MAKSARVKVDVSAEGWAQADKELAQLPILVRGIELEKAMRKGVNLVARRARQLAPPPGYPGDKPDKKALRDTIGTVLRRFRGGAVIGAIVGPEYHAGAHGHLVEFGTKPHTIVAKKKKVLANRELANTLAFDVFGRKVNHPGAKPNPFMEPAFNDVKGQIEPTIIAALQKAVKKHSG